VQQARFACCRHKGWTATAAAKASGYSGRGDDIRNVGSRAAKSTAVVNMLAFAAAEGKGGPDGNVDRAEARRLLSHIARHGDPSIRIRALEAINKMDEQDEVSEQEQSENSHPDPIRTLKQIA